MNKPKKILNINYIIGDEDWNRFLDARRKQIHSFSSLSQEMRWLLPVWMCTFDCIDLYHFYRVAGRTTIAATLNVHLFTSPEDALELQTKGKNSLVRNFVEVRIHLCWSCCRWWISSDLRNCRASCRTVLLVGTIDVKVTVYCNPF